MIINIEELKAAAERRRRFLNPSCDEKYADIYPPPEDGNYCSPKTEWFDRELLSDFGYTLLSDAPVTPEWLRETWGWKLIDVRYAQINITDGRGVRRILCWYGAGMFGVQGLDVKAETQGQATMLFLGLGLRPVRKDGE